MMPRIPVVGLAALALWTAAGCQPQSGTPERVELPADSAAGEIEFEMAGANGAALVVPVYLNGEGPFQFALDTGATLTCVDRQLRERLELKEQPGVVGVGAGATSAGRIGVVRVDSLRVGAARAESLPVCVLDLRHVERVGLRIDGLLGLNFLKPFRVTIDFQRRVLTLQEP